jgi:hypothetical protein
LVKRGGACHRFASGTGGLLSSDTRFLTPATHTEPPAGFLAGLQVAARLL